MEVVPRKYRELWKDWDLQIFVLFSLTLQIFLVSLGSRRKYIPTPLIRIVVWSAYLVADSIAILALGTLSNDLAEFNNEKGSPDKNMELTAFWAPFLLLHLGGPDTITAYSLEDNNLWLRHLLGLAFQTGGTIYIFLLAWTGSHLSILSILMNLAGFIKYSERVWVLRQASYEKLRNSPSEPTPNYSKLMEEKHLKMVEGYAVMHHEVNEVEGAAMDLSLFGDELILKAHGLLQRFKGLFVDLLLKVSDRDTSQFIFKDMSYEDSFKFVEIELGFMYDLLYTKAAILSRPWGCVLRIISLSLTFSVLVVFSLAVDLKYRKVDLAITLILLSVAVLLELYAMFVQLYSDRAFVWLCKHKKLSIISLAITFLQRFKRKRWSELMAQFSLISFSVSQNPIVLISRFLKCIDQKLEKEPFVAYGKISEHLKESIFKHLKEKLDDLSKRKEKLDDNLSEKKEKLDEESSGDADLKFLCSYRGRNVLGKFKCLKLLGWSTNVEFDESILIWQIATELSYYKDIENIQAEAKGKADTEPEAVTEAKAEMSKHISQYMLYLLVMYPFMLPTRIGQIRFEDTSTEVKNLIVQRKTISEYMHYLFHIFRISKHRPEDHISKACENLLEVKVKLPVSNAEGDRRNSVLFDACKLALQLKKISNKKKKWEMVSEVWLEMLTYAANQCSGNNHAQQLRRGGELLTHVWLLMAHLGISEQFQMLEGQVIAKIIAR